MDGFRFRLFYLTPEAVKIPTLAAFLFYTHYGNNQNTWTLSAICIIDVEW